MSVRSGSDTTLCAAGLRKTFGATAAVDDLTFEARAGEVVGFLGPNGAGKTTAIRVLTTILAPSAGRFAVAGIPDSRPGEIRRRVGVLPESAGYPGVQTGEEFLRYHAQLFGHTRASARAVTAARLEEVGLSERRSSGRSRTSCGAPRRRGALGHRTP